MPTLTIALAQINPTIGDIDGNLALMVAAARRAQAEGARLVAFPELSLTAYYPADLLEDPDFQRRLAKGIEDLMAATRQIPDLHWAIGAPTPNTELAPDQKDTDSLPPYEVLDPILKTLIEGARLPEKEGEAAMKFMLETSSTSEGKALIERVKRMIARNEYKRRQAPPILRVRSRAFGSGRQMPIAAKY